MSWFSGIMGKKKSKLSADEVAANAEQAMKDRKFGKLTVQFNPNVPEMKPVGTKFILNDDEHPLDFETKFFKGRMTVRVKNAVNAPVTKYFDGKARKFSIHVEGRFKKRIRADRVTSGSNFTRKIIVPWGATIAMKILCSIDASLRHDIFADEDPWVAGPLICGVEQCSVRKATEAENAAPRGLGPWTFGGNKRVEEDSHLFVLPEKRAKTKKMGFKERCRYFANKKRRNATFFEPENIYNFDFLSARVDFNTFDVVIGPFRKGMAPYINKQPFDFRATVYDDETNTKIIGHLFAIEFILDDVFEGAVATDETAAPDAEVAKALETQETAIARTGSIDEYDAALGLSPALGPDEAAAAAVPGLPDAESSS